VLYDILDVMTLESMKCWQTQETGNQAIILLNRILKTDFLVGLNVLRQIYALLKPVSTRLQQRGIKLVAARAEIDDTMSVSNAWREEATSVFHSSFC